MKDLLYNNGIEEMNFSGGNDYGTHSCYYRCCGRYSRRPVEGIFLLRCNACRCTGHKRCEAHVIAFVQHKERRYYHHKRIDDRGERRSVYDDCRAGQGSRVRFIYGGDTGKDERIYYFITKEILGDKSGTPAPRR